MASLPVLNQPPRRSGALLEHLARQMRVGSEKVLAPLGLRPRHLLALTVLRDRGGSSQQDLAKILCMDGTNIVGLLNDLEDDHLVERTRSPQDRRRHVVDLTDKGVKVLAKAEFAMAAVEDHVLAALTHDQRDALYSLLHQATNGEGPSPAACTGDDSC